MSISLVSQMHSSTCILYSSYLFLFFFTDTTATEIYTLSLHDALPIYDVHARELQALGGVQREEVDAIGRDLDAVRRGQRHALDRKSTRLNSSHVSISYAVFCLKKKKTSSHYYMRKNRCPLHSSASYLV